MTFSTRTNPRLPQSNMTGLGAVGGPQGVAAGGLRVILEFLTQYDPKAVKQLEADLAQLNSDLTNYNNQAAARLAKGERLEARIKTAQDRIQQADARNGNHRFKNELAQIRKLNENTNQRAEAQRRLQQLVTEVSATGVINNKRELSDLQRILTLDRQLGLNKKQRAALQAQINALQAQELTNQQRLAGFQGLKQGLAPRLSGLAIGAIGATIGGTILAGTVFMAMQAAVEAIGTAIYDNVIDPTHKSREAMQELGKAVDALEGLSDLEKAAKYLTDLGIATNEATVAMLAEAAANSRVRESLAAQVQVNEAAKHSEAEKKKIIEETAAALLEQDKIQGDVVTTTQMVGGMAGPILQDVADKQWYLTEATRQYQVWANASAQAAAHDAHMKQGLADANTRAAFTQQMLNAQIQAGIDRASASYDARINAIPTESARTRNLQNQISRAQSGGGGGSSSQQANIAEERALILLRMRLRELGTAINITKYEGKFRLEAINAKIKALQKEGDAQQRVNKLLELQYRMSQDIKRQEGESIKDFLERRAQENRSLLAERDQLRRDNQIAALNEQKEVLEDQVKLQELAERAKQAAIAGTQSAYIKSLQAQLKASQEKDKRQAEQRKKALAKEKTQLVEGANKGLELLSEENKKGWMLSLWGMDNINQLNITSGHLSGLLRGKASLEALARSWGVPQAVVAPFITEINKQLGYYWGAKARLTAKAQAGPPGGMTRIQLAEGGAFLLNNGSSPFGQNVQFGEQGTEIGVVLSNRVTDQLRKMNFPKSIGPFYMQGTNDPLRDQFALKRVVREAVAEALR